MYTIAVPSGPPQNITIIVGSRDITAFWSPIICSQCNGPILDYAVDFRSANGTVIPGVVINETFTADELTPYTNYIFRVAGMNDNGTGPFSSPITTMTDEDGILLPITILHSV